MKDLFSYGHVPVAFQYGGTPVTGIPANWNPRETVRRIDCNITETETVGQSPEGLELRVLCRRYHDFSAIEYFGWLSNRADTDSALVEDIRFAGTLPLTGAELFHGNGDNHQENSYEWYTTPLGGEALTLAPCDDGTSCNGAFPYMRLKTPDAGVNIAIGWSGIWTVEFTQLSDHVSLRAGQKRCHMVLHPGETMRIPTLTLVSYRGDEDTGRNTWRRWYFAHILPKQHGKLMEPKCCMHLSQAQGKPEFTGATEENQLAAIDGYLQAGIRPDVWWIDAGWYPCDYNWKFTGNWYPNPRHFPNGLKPIGDKCHEADMELLLWFEPERIQRDSDFDRDHPQWLLHGKRNGQDHQNRLVNLGIPECCDYVTDLLDGCIKAFGVDIYRQDFNLRSSDINFGPGEAWKDAETQDRIGAVENLHIQGYYRMWDALLARNPGLIIDSCASGGRRNDLETMRRSITLHYTDVGYGNHPIKLKQHRQMFEWIPYFRAHNMNWCAEDGSYDTTGRLPDRYSYYAAMAPALTDMTRYDAGEDAFALARQMQAIWRRAASLMIGTDYYPLTQCRKSSDDFYAAQFHDPARNNGFVHLVNGSTATEEAWTLQLRGLDPETTYVLTASEGGQTLTRTGAALMDGFDVIQPRHTGNIWFYQQK